MPAAGARRLARLVRVDARRALHRDLLDQPGRRGLQGLRPDLPRGAALDRDVAVREARDLAPHHAGRHRLALQPLRRARPRRRAAASRPRPPRRSGPRRRMTRLGLRRGARRIAPLAWPVFVGQVAVIAFSTVDTVMVARTSATRPRRARRSAASVYISIFVGLMGTVLAIGPIAGQLYGAGKLRESGHEAQQAAWLALGLAVPAACCCSLPEPFLALARAEPAVAAKVRDYLHGLAFALPPALVFTAFRGFNVAVSRPKAVMAMQLGGLALKVPVNAVLVFGAALPTPFGELDVPALGVAGCGLATAIVMWLPAGGGAGPAAPRPLLSPLRPRPRPDARAAERGQPGGAASPRRADGAGGAGRGDRLHLHGVLRLAHRRDRGRRPPDRRQHGLDDVHAAAGDRQRLEHAGRPAGRRRRRGRCAPDRLGRSRDRRRHRRACSAAPSTCCASRWSASTPPTR